MVAARSARCRRYPAPRVLASSAMPITTVVSARRGSTDPSSSTWVAPHAIHRARRGRRVSVLDPWSRTRRQHPYPQGRSIPLHLGQVSSPAVRRNGPSTDFSASPELRCWFILLLPSRTRQRSAGRYRASQPIPTCLLPRWPVLICCNTSARCRMGARG